MAAHDTSILQASRRVPRRDGAGRLMLTLALFGPLMAWTVHLLVASSLASLACSPGGGAAVGGFWVGLLVISLIALAIAVVAGLAALRDWNKNRAESQVQVPIEQVLTEVGEDRDLFLASWAIMTSGYIVLALIFATLAVLIVPVCSG